MVVVDFLCEFISSNPFIVCSDELSYIKKELLSEKDELKVRQKTGSLHYVARQGGCVVGMETSHAQLLSGIMSCAGISWTSHWWCPTTTL
jgi:hypothetical protein